MMNSENTRKRCVSELQKRYNAVPYSFWEYYINLSEDDKRVALLYSLLCAYQLLKDLHVNVVQSRWLSIEKTLNAEDLMMEVYNIASRDEFVDSWSEETYAKIVSWYQTVLVQVGMLSRSTKKLSPVYISDYSWFRDNNENVSDIPYIQLSGERIIVPLTIPDKNSRNITVYFKNFSKFFRIL